MILRIGVVYKDIVSLSNLNNKVAVYIINIHSSFSKEEIEKIGSLVSDPVIHNAMIFSYDEKIRNYRSVLDQSEYKFVIPSANWFLEIGFLPGVTDNCANIAKQIIGESLGYEFKDGESVHSLKVMFGQGNPPEESQIKKLFNPLTEYSKLICRDDNCNYKVQFFGNDKVLRLNNLYLDNKSSSMFLIPFVRQSDLDCAVENSGDFIKKKLQTV